VEKSIQDAKNYVQWINDTVRLDSYSSNAKNRKVFRGQVYWCNFGINIGSEQSGRRPCVILQHDQGNIYSANTIVAPLTHSNSKLDVVVPITDKHDNNGDLILDGYVLLGNIKTISKARLENFITKLSANDMKKIDEAIVKSLGVYQMIQVRDNCIAGQERHIANLGKDIIDKNNSIIVLENRISALTHEVEKSVNRENSVDT